MKDQFIIIGTQGVTCYVFTGTDFVTTPWDSAKRFKSRSAADREIDRMFGAGSTMQMGSIVAPPSAASALGKLGAGKPKNYGLDETIARAERMAAARAKRWPKK